jgi:hypothetical protein
VEKE